MPESRDPGLLWDQASLVLQKFPAERFTATTELTLSASRAGARSGLAVMGRDYAFVAVEKASSGWRLVYVVNKDADKGEKEVVQATAPLSSGHVWMRVTAGEAARSVFSYSADGRTYSPIGSPFTAREGVWVGARLGLFTAPLAGTDAGHTDIDWFRIE